MSVVSLPPLPAIDWVATAGVAIGVVAIVVTIVLYFISRQKKRLGYRVLSQTPLVTVGDELQGQIRILYNGQDVQNVNLALISLTNSGNVAITRADFDAPLEIEFGARSRLLSAEIIEMRPDNLDAQLTLHDHSLALEPLLMNKGDSVRVKALVNKSGDDAISINTRLVGGRVEELPEQLSSRTMMTQFGFIVVVSGLQLAYFLGRPRDDWVVIAFAFLMLLAGVAYFAWMIKVVRRRGS